MERTRTSPEVCWPPRLHGVIEPKGRPQTPAHSPALPSRLSPAVEGLESCHCHRAYEPWVDLGAGNSLEKSKEMTTMYTLGLEAPAVDTGPESKAQDWALTLHNLHAGGSRWDVSTETRQQPQQVGHTETDSGDLKPPYEALVWKHHQEVNLWMLGTRQEQLHVDWGWTWTNVVSYLANSKHSRWTRQAVSVKIVNK